MKDMFFIVYCCVGLGDILIIYWNIDVDIYCCVGYGLRDELDCCLKERFVCGLFESFDCCVEVNVVYVELFIGWIDIIFWFDMEFKCVGIF